MNRRIVDARTSRDLNAGNALWETPPPIWAALQRDFGPFDVDLTANRENTLCEAWLGPGSALGEDALTATWGHLGRRGYSNPVYGPFAQRIVRVAKAHARAPEPFVSVFLLPMRVTETFKHIVLFAASALYFCDRRVCFYEHGAPRLNPKTGKADPAMFDSIIVVFERRRAATGLMVDVWRVPEHV